MYRTMADWLKALNDDVAAIYPFADWLEEEGHEYKAAREFVTNVQTATRIWEGFRAEPTQSVWLCCMNATTLAFLCINPTDERFLTGYTRERLDSDSEEMLSLVYKILKLPVIK